MATMVMVHGGFSGGFAWDDLVPALRERGHEVRVVDQMPTAGHDPDDLGTLEDDVALLRALLDDVGSDAVAVGHSSGGLAVREVADHPALLRSVYVAAFLPPPGTSMMQLIEGAPPLDWQEPVGGTAARVVDDVDVAHRGLAHDADRAAFERCFHRYTLQAMAPIATPLVGPPHPRAPVYVVCEEDRCVPVPAQEQFAAGVGATVERMPTSHLPMLSAPDDLAAVLDRAARS